MKNIMQEIMEIAYDCFHRGAKMTFQQLSKELTGRGFISKTGRGLARQVSAAFYRAKKENNLGIAEAIAHAFTDKNGKYFWK